MAIFESEKKRKEEAANLYSQKYHDGSIFLVLKSLAYFEDADEQGVTVTIVIHIVIAGQHQLTAKPNRERKEDLGGGQGPDLKTERS